MSSPKRGADKAPPEAAQADAPETVSAPEAAQPPASAMVTMEDVEAAIERAKAAAMVEANEMVEALHERLGQFRGDFKHALEALSFRVDEVSRAPSLPGNVSAELAEIRGVLGRIGTALNRQDLLTPPATAEQVRAALKVGCTLLVLQAYKAMGVAFEAGRKLESNAFEHRSIIDGVASGKLLVSIVATKG